MQLFSGLSSRQADSTLPKNALRTAHVDCINSARDFARAPALGLVEKTKPLPASIADAVLAKTKPAEAAAPPASR